MRETSQLKQSEIKGKPIGGWLWAILIILIASGLQIVIHLITTTNELLLDDWKPYFEVNDELLKRKRFPVIFLGVLGYFILTEVLRTYFLDYYANLTGQDATNIESNLIKTGIVAIIAGLYLNKGKRPNQTFVK